MREFVAGKGPVFHEREPAVLKGAGADGPVQLTNITAAPHGPPLTLSPRPDPGFRCSAWTSTVRADTAPPAASPGVTDLARGPVK